MTAITTKSLATAIRTLINSHKYNKQQLHDLAEQGIKHSLEHGDSNALSVTKELIAIDHTNTLAKVIRMVDFDLPQKLGRKYALNKARNNQEEALKLWAQAFEEAEAKAFDVESATAYANDANAKAAVNTAKIAQLSEWLANVVDAPSIAMEAVGSAIDTMHKQVTAWRSDVLAISFLSSDSRDYPRLSEKDFAAFERALARMVRKFGGKLPE
jgi:hypothetical protein